MRITVRSNPEAELASNQWPLYIAEGLGNRIFIVDEQSKLLNLRPDEIIATAKEWNGCDQILAISPTIPTEKRDLANIDAKIWNKDGSSANNCINGVRCVALLGLLGGLGKSIQNSIRERSINIRINGNKNLVRGGFDPRRGFGHVADGVAYEFPISFVDCIGLENFEANPKLADGLKKNFPIQNSAYVNLGNPHLVLFLDRSADILDMAETHGKTLESQLSDTSIFRDGVNISFAKIDNPSEEEPCIDLQVWERGAGATVSCGSGAAAVCLAAERMKIAHAKRDMIIRPAKTRKTDENFLCWMAQSDTVGVCGKATLDTTRYILNQPAPPAAS